MDVNTFKATCPFCETENKIPDNYLIAGFLNERMKPEISCRQCDFIMNITIISPSTLIVEPYDHSDHEEDEQGYY